MLRRRLAGYSGWKENNERSCDKSEPRVAAIQKTGLIFTMKVPRQEHLRVQRGNQTSCAPASTANSSPAWRTVAAPSAITTKTKRSETDSQRRRAIRISAKKKKRKKEKRWSEQRKMRWRNEKCAGGRGEHFTDNFLISGKEEICEKGRSEKCQVEHRQVWA